MKKHFLLKSLSCVLSLLFIFSLFCIFAAAETETGSSNASNPAAYVYVRDKANVFSDEQIQRIYQKILDERSKLDKKGKSVLFYVVTYPMDNSYDRYTGDDLLSEIGASISDDIIALVITKNLIVGSYTWSDPWYYDLYTYGDALTAISEKEVDRILDDGKVYNNLKFRDDSEAKIEGIEAFLDKSGQAYAGRLGAPFGKVLLIAFIIALLGAGLVCLGVVLKYNMKTKQNIYPLEHYTKMKLNDSSDVFKGSYVRKRIIQTSSGGRSGGSSGGAGGGSGHRGGR